MVQRKQLSWTELRVGVFVLAGIILIVLGVFYVTGTGAWGPKYHLVTYLPEVAGLTIGAPVTVDGVDVGNVDTIRMATVRPGQPPNHDRAVEVVMRINRDFQDYVRTDSSATLFTQGFVGNRVVSIQRGFTGQVLRDGQEVPGVAEKAMTQVVSRGADLMQNLNMLTSQISQMVAGIQQGQGTIGKLLHDETAYNRLNAVLSRADQITSSVQQGQGTIGRLITSDALYAKADSAVGHLDNVMAAVDQQKGSLGKFIFDPSFHDSARQLLDNGNALLSGVRDGRGTLGKLATDDELYATWRQAGENLKQVTADLNSPNSSAGKFFTNPQFYDNTTGVAGDLRLLLNEFRQNPAKFLKVKLSLF